MTRELRFLADRGWLRSYVLTCDGVPCSFILGHQYGSCFYAELVGVDDAWRSYSAGTVILVLVLEDLFKENSPKFYDFGTHVKFQEIFATESYPEATVWLFRRRAYPVWRELSARLRRNHDGHRDVIRALRCKVQAKKNVMEPRAAIKILDWNAAARLGPRVQSGVCLLGSAIIPGRRNEPAIKELQSELVHHFQNFLSFFLRIRRAT